jgi:hypothetical protein
MIKQNGPYKKEPIVRFNEKYTIDKKTGCWLWTACLEKSGYAHFTDINGKPCRAHRFSYEYFIGPLDKNLEICHNCHNKSCVNPDHLRQDTKSSNTMDKLKEKVHCNQILSIEEVLEIKKAQLHYYRGQNKDLAHFYKVSQGAISDIKIGKRWSHVQI